MANDSELCLSFEGGTVCLRGFEDRSKAALNELPTDVLVWDERIAAYRTPAVHYALVVRWLREHHPNFVDDAAQYDRYAPNAPVRQKPFPYQLEAVSAWEKADGRGVVVLPTGSGKTYVATLAMDRRPRSTLIVVPTIDLMNQWYDLLHGAFERPIGIVGGGYHDVCDITVTTYDSAYIHMERFGNVFGMVVFDECHHLPSESYAMAARACLAPLRLGLSATPERSDGGEALYDELIGPVVYRKDIDELSGSYLADYETQRVSVSLTADERAEYDSERGLYLAFLRKYQIRMGTAGGWTEFIIQSSRSDEGRRAFMAHRNQRRLSLASQEKISVLQRLLHAHRKDRTIVFTEDNATVYAIAARFLVPAITHQTKIKERRQILQALNRGDVGVVVTSKVLNEGVNVPEANVAIVLSGSGSVREHVQRLGRILRKREGKRAILYELVSSDTSEEFTSAKRREHRAYH